MSAVTGNYVRAHELAASRLEQEAVSFQTVMESFRSPATRAGSLFSSPRDIAASYLMDDLRYLVKSLTRASQEHRTKISVLRRSPCPCCLKGQRQHCASCGSCPGRGRGPSCEDLECLQLVPVS